MKGKRGTHKIRRALALALCFALLCPLLGQPGFAEEAGSGGLCPHHPQHTEDCGWSAGSPESPCTHVHDESCYLTACVHEGEEGHACSVESGCLTLACGHSHDETCGYAPEVPASPCRYDCPDCAAPDGEAAPGTDPAEDPDGGDSGSTGDGGPLEGEPQPGEETDDGEGPKDEEEPKDGEEETEPPLDPSALLLEAELTDPESGETLCRLTEGGEAVCPAWPLEGERLLRLRAAFPAGAAGSWQLRLQLSPLLCLAESGPWEGFTVCDELVTEESAPGRTLLIAPDPALFPAEAEGAEPRSAVLELTLRLAVDQEQFAARMETLAEAEEAEDAESGLSFALPEEELLKLELRWDGLPLPERSSVLRGTLDPGISLMALDAPYRVDPSGKNFANLVLFAYFSDQTDGAAYFRNTDTAQSLWNLYEGSSRSSFRNYISTVSYGRMQVLNVLPQYDSETHTIQAVQLPFTRQQAMSGNIDSGIVSEALKAVNVDGSILDLNGDGVIDNVTVVLKGPKEPSGDMNNEDEGENSSYSCHKSDYPGSLEAFGKHVSAYNMLNTDRLTGMGGSGTIAHEFLHTLGFMDLYNNQGDFPVYTWDIMANSSSRPSWPLAYTRMLQGWVNLSTCTKSGTLTFRAPGEGDGSSQAYILQSPQNDRELFVVEMRHKSTVGSDELDFGLSAYMDYNSSALIVYRVDLTAKHLSNHYGETAIYVFRPNSTGDQRQNVQHAFLNSKENRTSLGSADHSFTLEQGAITFADGTNSCIVIKDVKNNPDGSMSCQVEIPDAKQYDTWEDTGFKDASGGNRSAATASCKNTQYLVTYTNGTIRTYRYTGNVWNELPGASWTEANRLPPDMRMTEYQGKLYLAYMDQNAHVKIRALDVDTGRWEDIYTGTELINGLEILSQNGSFYVVYETGEKAGLLEVTGAAAVDRGSYDTAGSGGQPQEAYVGDTLYVSRRLIDNSIKIYRREASGSYTVISDGELSAPNYSLAALNGKLVVVTGENEISGANKTVKVHFYDGSSWTHGKGSAIDCFDPKLTVLQGNLYLLASPSTEAGYTYVYQYDPGTDGWIQEGERVDSRASQITLTADADYLYISYVRSQDASVHVRRKALANPLLSLELDPPKKTSYVQGEKVSTEGMVVTARYQRDTRVLEEGEYQLTGFDSGSLGSRRATVSYGGKMASFTYTVNPPAASGLGQPVLGAVTDTGYGLKLSWSAVSGAAKYQVYVRFNGGKWTAVGVTGNLSYTWKPDKGAGTYAFTVQALSADGKTVSTYDQTGKSIRYEPLKLTLSGLPASYKDGYVYIDGVKIKAEAPTGSSRSLTLPDAKAKTAVMYEYNAAGVPVGMTVWRLSYTGTQVRATELKGLKNLLSYHGFSIRITGAAGIRVKSGIAEATRAQLLSAGVDGYRLMEYGTMYMPSGNDRINAFTLENVPANARGMAYGLLNGRRYDQIFERIGGRIRFTSVLTGLKANMYDQKLTFRSYAILDSGGQQIVVYGAPVESSVYTVATKIQAAHEFAPGTAGYRFVQNIVDSVESGKK